MFSAYIQWWDRYPWVAAVIIVGGIGGLLAREAWRDWREARRGE